MIANDPTPVLLAAEAAKDKRRRDAEARETAHSKLLEAWHRYLATLTPEERFERLIH